MLQPKHAFECFFLAALYVCLFVGMKRLTARAEIATMGEPAPALQSQEESNLPSPQSLRVELEAALSQGKTDKVNHLVTDLLRSPQLEPDLLLQLGIRMAQQELYDEAARVFARCVQDHPEIFEAHYNLALAEFAIRDFPKALTAVESGPHGSEQQETARLYLRGKIRDALGQSAEAEKDLSAAFAAAPREENYALDLGLFYIRQRAYQQAVAVFERGWKLNPQSTFLGLGLALAQFLRGRAAESILVCEKVINLRPDFTPAQLLMAFALYLNGEFGKAEKATASGLRAPHPYPYLYYLHVVTLLKLQSQDYGHMLEELTLANRGIPKCSLCYLAESKVHQAMGDDKAALAALEKAVDLDSGFPEAWYRLASVYEQVGRHEDALRARRRFRELKSEKSSRETEMIRNEFLRTLAGPETFPVPH